MSTPVQPVVAPRWYEDAEKLKQKREEAGVSDEVLAQRIGRHSSYVHEVEAGRILLVWENAELIWSTLSWDLRNKQLSSRGQNRAPQPSPQPFP